MKRPLFIFLILLCLLTGLRVWLAASEEWTADEAYLFLISRHLDWAYFDAPSGLPALVHLSEVFLGPSPFALRLPSILFSLLASLAALWAGRTFFSLPVGIGCAIFINLLPAFNLASLCTTDLLPFLTFWLAFSAFAFRAIQSNRWMDWLATTLCGACGMLLDYRFFLAAIALPLAIASSHKTRALFRKPAFYLCFLSMLILGTTGPFLWNEAHDWISFSGQTLLLLHTFAGKASVVSSGELLSALGILPLFALIAALIWTASLARRHTRPRLLLVFAGLPACGTAYALFRGYSADTLGLAALALASLFLIHQILSPADALRRHPFLTHIGIVLLLLTPLSLTALQLQSLAQTQTSPPWAAIEERLERAITLNQPAGARPLFFIASDRNLASGLGYFLLTSKQKPRDFPPVYLRESQDTSSQFGLWPRYDEVLTSLPVTDPSYKEESGSNPNLGRSALYIGYEAPNELPQPITSGFEKVSALEKIELTNGFPLYLYLCENYHMTTL